VHNITKKRIVPQPGEYSERKREDDLAKKEGAGYALRGGKREIRWRLLVLGGKNPGKGRGDPQKRAKNAQLRKSRGKRRACNICKETIHGRRSLTSRRKRKMIGVGETLPRRTKPGGKKDLTLGELQGIEVHQRERTSKGKKRGAAEKRGKKERHP